MKNGKIKLAVTALIIGILMVGGGIVGLNYKTISRMMNHSGDNDQSSALDSSDVDDFEKKIKKILEV